MRKLLPLLLVFILVLAACGGDDDDDDDSAGSIADAENCDEVGEVFLDEMQVLLDELSDMSITDISGDEQPEALTNFETSIDEISAKADELECSDEEMADFMRDNLDELEADGPVAELLLEGFREGVESGEIFEGGITD
jgi:hypothetical protein